MPNQKKRDISLLFLLGLIIQIPPVVSVVSWIIPSQLNSSQLSSAHLSSAQLIASPRPSLVVVDERVAAAAARAGAVAAAGLDQAVDAVGEGGDEDEEDDDDDGDGDVFLHGCGGGCV